jgi:hypothetical protein
MMVPECCSSTLMCTSIQFSPSTHCFDAAVENFARAARSLGLAATPRDGMLLLTETDRSCV